MGNVEAAARSEAPPNSRLQPTAAGAIGEAAAAEAETLEADKKRGSMKADDGRPDEMAEASLDPFNPQSEYSAGLLRLFREAVLQDRSFVERSSRQQHGGSNARSGMDSRYRASDTVGTLGRSGERAPIV